MPSASRAVITPVPPPQERGEPRGDDASRAQPYNAPGWEAVDEQEGAQEAEQTPPQQTTWPDRHRETTVSKPQARSPPTPPSTQDHHLRKALCRKDTAETGSTSSRDVGSQPGKKPQKILGGPRGGAVDESPPVNAGDTGSSPGLGRSHVLQSHSAREPQLPSLRSGAQEPPVLRATLEGSATRGAPETRAWAPRRQASRRSS